MTYVCVKCRGSNVQVPAWIDPNKNTVEDLEYLSHWRANGFTSASWCGDCEETDLGVVEASELPEPTPAEGDAHEDEVLRDVADHERAMWAADDYDAATR